MTPNITRNYVIIVTGKLSPFDSRANVQPTREYITYVRLIRHRAQALFTITIIIQRIIYDPTINDI